MRKANLIIPLGVRLEYIIKLLYGGILLFLLYLLITDSLILRWIPVSTVGLMKIGTVQSVKGHILRQLTNDTLHLPLNDSENLFNDDLIITESGSSAQLLIGVKNKIITEPNTTIRLTLNPEGLMIHIQLGSVITDFQDDTWITVKAGMKNDKIQIRKGTYFIKNSGSGIQITSFSTENLIKKGLTTQTDTKKTMMAAPEADLIDDKKEDIRDLASEKKEQEAEKETLLNEKKAEVPLELPHPQDKIIFLVKNAQPITIAAKPVCLKHCFFRLFKNDKILVEKEFAEGEVSFYSFQFENSESGHFRWTYQDAEDKMEFTFDLQPFSNEAFDKALNLGESIEIL